MPRLHSCIELVIVREPVLIVDILSNLVSQNLSEESQEGVRSVGGDFWRIASTLLEQELCSLQHVQKLLQGLWARPHPLFRCNAAQQLFLRHVRDFNHDFLLEELCNQLEKSWTELGWQELLLMLWSSDEMLTFDTLKRVRPVLDEAKRQNASCPGTKIPAILQRLSPPQTENDYRLQFAIQALERA